jgi:GNAT superfamily N-acetyltransferase
MAFEAPDYEEKGIESFKAFIEQDAMVKAIEKGTMFFFGAFEDQRMVGVMAVRDANHISLLFVDPAFHRRGIALALIQEGFKDWSASVTVNSSPYALAFYRKMEFVDQDEEQLVDGIRFIPMKRG